MSHWNFSSLQPKFAKFIVKISLLLVSLGFLAISVTEFLEKRSFFLRNEGDLILTKRLEERNDTHQLPTIEFESFYSYPGCHCVRSRHGNKSDASLQSTCSFYATNRGGAQKVFSYGYYRPRYIKNDSMVKHVDYYLKQLEENLIVIKENYPGWVVRLYHNVSSEDTLESDYICYLYCQYDFFDPCPVEDLPTIGNLSSLQECGRTWRFSVMGDPTVDIFFSRDSDSIIIKREMDAVNEWLNSNKSFHMMKDSPGQKMLFQAGMWGARNKAKYANWRERMFSKRIYSNFRTFDQMLLEAIVYPNIDKDDLLVHASYDCKSYGKSAVPFPTRRYGLYYVGWGHFKKFGTRILKGRPCPFECRPKTHIEWIYC